MTNSKLIIPKVWLDKNNKKISCKEKVKIIKTNINEFQEVLTDIIDEVVLIGVNEDQLKDVLLNIVKNSKNNLKNV